MEQNNNTKKFNLEQFNEFALNVNGKYVKMYVTSSMQTVHFLKNSGALVLYYAPKGNDNDVYKLDKDVFQLYLNDQLLFSGNGFNDDIRDELLRICKEYEKRIGDIESTRALIKDVNKKVDIIGGNITETKVYVNKLETTGPFLRSLVEKLNELESQIKNIQNENKTVSLNYKIKDITIHYTRYIGEYNNAKSNITQQVSDNIQSNNHANLAPYNLFSSTNRLNISPIETYKYKLGEKNMLPEGSRILEVLITIEIMNVYNQTSTKVAFVTDFNTNKIVDTNDETPRKDSSVNMFFQELTKGKEIIETSTINFVIDYWNSSESNHDIITTYDGYVIENGKNTIINKVFYVEDVTNTQNTQNNILALLETSNLSIDNIINNQTELYNIYSLINEQIIIYGYKEIYYGHALDNPIYNDIYNYLGSVPNLCYIENKPYSGMKICPIYDDNNHVQLKLNWNIKEQQTIDFNGINSQLEFTPVTVIQNDNDVSLYIDELIICIPNEYSITDIVLHIFEKYYNVSSHTKLLYVIDNMPNYFCGPKDKKTQLINQKYMNSSKYKVYGIYNISVSLTKYMNLCLAEKTLLPPFVNVNGYQYVLASNEFQNNTFLNIEYSHDDNVYTNKNLSLSETHSNNISNIIDELQLNNNTYELYWAIAPNMHKFKWTENSSRNYITNKSRRLPTDSYTLYFGNNSSYTNTALEIGRKMNELEILKNDGKIDYRTIINDKISDIWIYSDNRSDTEMILGSIL